MTSPKITVLIVDDEPIGREVLRGILVNQGYDLAFAADGPETLLQAAQLEPDLILLDVMMREMSGFEVCRQLRADPALADIPVIMVTALADPQSRLLGLEAGANDFISKPFDRTELRARVRTITGLNALRRQHLQDLQTERDRIRAILESVREAVVVTDPGGIIQYANPAAADLTGFADGTLVGQNWRIWRSDQQPADFYSQVESTISLKCTWQGEVVHQHRDGHTYDAFLSVAPLFDPHQPDELIGMVSVQLDITQIKEAERLKSRFISNISHELNTPLSVIILHAENLKNLYGQLSDSQRQKLIDDVSRHAQHLEQLISGVLDIARLDSEPAFTRREVINLNQLVQAEVARQQPLAHQKKQHLTVSATGVLLVSGQSEPLQQVFSNLLNNAIKYTPSGGQITCHGCVWKTPVAMTEPSWDDWPGLAGLPPGQWAAYRVTDTGIGISPEHMPHLFERFFRVKNESNVRGVGLGLSIVQEVVHRHYGQVTVASTLGVGTTFAVYLPLY